MIVTRELQIETKGCGDIVDVTSLVQQELSSSGLSSGAATVFVAHTTAGIGIIETEGGLLEDFRSSWERVAPQGLVYQHNIRAHDDNAHSHLRATLLGPSLVVPFTRRKLTLGTWQRLILVDFDTRPRQRNVVFQFLGE